LWNYSSGYSKENLDVNSGLFLGEPVSLGESADFFKSAASSKLLGSVDHEVKGLD